MHQLPIAPFLSNADLVARLSSEQISRSNTIYCDRRIYHFLSFLPVLGRGLPFAWLTALRGATRVRLA